MGFAGKWPLNPNLDNDALRALFKKHGVLQGYLHEFPGMADAMLLLEKGAITKAEFKAQLAANLFHNGPAEGFWKLLTDAFVPGALGKDPEAFKFFEGTVFQGTKTPEGLVKPIYPSPKTFEGSVHSFFDRMSQATRGGVVKIFEEIRGFDQRGPLGMMEELLTENPKNTLKQIDKLEDMAKSLKPPQKEQALEKLLAAGKKRIAQYNQDVTEGIKTVKNADNKVESMTIKYPSGENVSISQTGLGTSITTTSADGSVTVKTFPDPKAPNFGDAVRDEVDRFLKDCEKRHGDPVRELKI